MPGSQRVNCHGGTYSVAFQGPNHANGQVFVDVAFQWLRGTGCRVSQPVGFSLAVQGHALATVRDDPLEQPTKFELGPDRATRVVVPGWTNWCGRHLATFTFRMSFRGVRVAKSASMPPTCLNPGAPSRLLPGHPEQPIQRNLTGR
jgi:hypothetical protein